MSEAEVTQSELHQKALQAFLVGNRDLERLEALLDQFNIFEALGVVRQELRHSDFLAFLLDPQENHRLGDIFVKRLLQRVIKDAEYDSLPLTPIELELSNLDQVTVLREWQHIDILLLDESNHLAVIIENKIGTGEHSDQLQRYYRIVSQRYHQCRIVGLYLTPSGEEPSHESYLPVDYGLICEILDDLAESRASVLDTDLQILLKHYTQMLRRHVVGNSEMAELCQRIYKDHRRALDLIYKHRPDAQAEIKDILEGFIKSEPRLMRDSGGKKIIRFTVQEWDTLALLTSSGWTRSKRILMFEFWNNPDYLWVALVVGPGSDEIRQKLFDVARANPKAFEDPWKAAGAWYVIFSRQLLDWGVYEDVDQEEREREIRKQWTEFLDHDLPRIDAVLKEEKWIWQSNEGEETT